MSGRISAEQWRFKLALAGGQRLSGGVDQSQDRVELIVESVDLGYRVQLRFLASEKCCIESCQLEVPNQSQPDEWLLANGFQSWSESYWHRPSGHIPSLRRIARPLMGYFGDYHIDLVQRGPGIIHSWSWTERRSTGEKIELLASLNENTAFSCFHWRQDTGTIQVDIDCRGWEVDEPVVLADFVVLEGTVDEVYDEWTRLMQLPSLRTPIARGWTSWYQHYTSVSEQIIDDNLQAFGQTGKRLNYFQIDDGFQTAIGDWLSISSKFPSGMANVADKIRETGTVPGLWLAPAVADRRSELLKNHSSWVQKGSNGKPLKAGYIPLWDGWFYALDTEHEGWQEYMQEVFRTAVEEWGYGMLKLDFLYAACIFPSKQYTRAQLLRRMLERIRAWSGEAVLLGCGTPLAPGFGLFDYCRIGADIHLSWEHPLLRWFRHRERVSTLVALRSVLGRWPLAGRVWRNDPDVYLLREKNIQMSQAERQLVHRLNTLLGELIFTSDNPSTYGSFQAKEEEWQHLNWQKKDWKVTPLPGGQFHVASGESAYQVALQRKTGTWKEVK